MLLSWLLVLSTAIRRAAVAEIVGLSSPEAVNVAKGLVIVATWLLIACVVFAALRLADREHRSQTIAVGSAVFAAFVVAANFVLIYSYIAALVDPDTSGSVVVVLTILAWVNIVVRGLFYTAVLDCRVTAEGRSARGVGRAARSVDCVTGHAHGFAASCCA